MPIVVAEEQQPLQSAAENFNKGLKIDQIGHVNDQENQRRMFSDNFQESQEETPFMTYEMNFSGVPEVKIETSDGKGEEGKDDGEELLSSKKIFEEPSSFELGSGKSASEEDEDYPQQINNDTSITEMVQDFFAIETEINGTGEGQYDISCIIKSRFLRITNS